MKVVVERNRLAHLGLLISLSALVGELLKAFEFKPLAAYAFGTTIVCQANAFYMRSQEAAAAAEEDRAARDAVKAAPGNPKKKRR